MTDESSESCEMKKWDVFCENNDLLFENEQLQAENAELRKELAVTNPLFETLNAANDRLIYENMKLREQIETLAMYVESDGTRYWVDDDGNQHFDHSATVKDDADKLRELVRDFIDAPCTTCDCWQDEFRCWNYDGADCGLVARARELGVEV